MFGAPGESIPDRLLERFVETASKIRSKQHKSRTLLLVDGYDELFAPRSATHFRSPAQVSGPCPWQFLLSCREYYHVFQLAAREVRIDGFTREDKYRFVQAFLSAYDSPLDPKEVVDDFEARGFSEFLSHPLLLALACILKTSRASVQSESATRLLERALDVLCYRWDEQKGLDRHAVTPLDGKDRIAVLKRIAYVAKSSHVLQHHAEELARKQLDLLLRSRRREGGRRLCTWPFVSSTPCADALSQVSGGNCCDSLRITQFATA